jgi:hypothetical protein
VNRVIMSLIRKISKGRSARYKNKNKKEAEEARVEECKKAPEDDGGTYAEEPQNSDAKKQNGSAFRTNSLGSGTRTPPLERKSKFSIGKLLRPWKWKRKKKSDKLEAVSRTLERKISVRANRDELVQKGILLPESPLTPPISEPGESR